MVVVLLLLLCFYFLGAFAVICDFVLCGGSCHVSFSRNYTWEFPFLPLDRIHTTLWSTQYHYSPFYEWCDNTEKLVRCGPQQSSSEASTLVFQMAVFHVIFIFLKWIPSRVVSLRSGPALSIYEIHSASLSQSTEEVFCKHPMPAYTPPHAHIHNFTHASIHPFIYLLWFQIHNSYLDLVPYFVRLTSLEEGLNV